MEASKDNFIKCEIFLYGKGRKEIYTLIFIFNAHILITQFAHFSAIFS